MKSTKQILLAFFIPLFSAICLLILRLFVFYDSDEPWRAKFDGGFVTSEYVASEYLNIIGLLILGLFVLSFISPSFVMMRMYQGRQNRLESPTILNKWK